MSHNAISFFVDHEYGNVHVAKKIEQDTKISARSYVGTASRLQSQM